jgi:ABC-type multidrug transport system fused ATPase/permease subunit
MDNGAVAEFDSPKELMGKRGIFYGMVMDTGAQNAELFLNLK